MDRQMKDRKRYRQTKDRKKYRQTKDREKYRQTNALTDNSKASAETGRFQD
jgi:hypothetical protein